MAEFKDYATDNQLKAVEHQGHDILVSASAGSGKTKVLVERIKNEIIHENASISRMLIMTFTTAAAREMKERLTKILNEELQKQIENHGNPQLISHLQKQLTAVNIADISTIDAFCLHFLKKYYYAIDLDPNFRVLADESERNLIREEVWENVREDFYQKYEDLTQVESPSDEQVAKMKKYDDFFRIFVQDRRDDDLTAVVYRLNDFASANSNPEQWLAQAPQNYDFTEETFTQTKIWQDVLKQSVIDKLHTLLGFYQKYRHQFETIQVPAMKEYYKAQEKKLKKLTDKTDVDFEKLDEVTTKIENVIDQITNNTITWNQLRDQIEQCRFSAKRYAKKTDFDPDDPELINEIECIKNNPKEAKKIIDDLQKNEFFFSDRQLHDVLKRAQDVVELIVELVQRFRKQYLSVKLQRHVLEFSDLEYLTLKILHGDQELQQKIREELKQHYTEIMLDEYQDTNGVQEAIVQAIANHNLFMVGDVKQSIYRFRQADPSLFMSKYQSFTPDDQSNDFTNGELIVLQENFRSIKNVADLTNMIFMQIMDQQLGEIDYDQLAFLKAENPMYKQEGLTNTIPAKALIYLQKNESDQADDEVFQLDSKLQGQFVLIANQIKKMMASEIQIFDRDQGQMRPLRYSDIAILSSTRQDSAIVNDEFKRLGIPTDVVEKDNYFKTTEIQIMVSYLKIIDNPHQDIPLVAVLRSPMYQFDENELAYLRINHKHGDYYSALTDFITRATKDPDCLTAWDETKKQALITKVKRFTTDLTTFRVQAKRSEIASLIWNIYTTTGFLDYVGGLPGGAQRQANLHALYERATAYEKTSFKGLFQFIRFIERMDKQQQDLPEMKIQVNEDAVKFMTIHGSKGLEFPVVFIVDLNKKFNMQDLNQKYALDDQYGVGLDIVESSKKVLQRDYQINLDEDDAIEVCETTPVNLAIKDRIKRKSLAEEMRKLYVALTRAEQYLYLVGSYDSIDKWAASWGEQVHDEDVLIPEHNRYAKTTFMDWIGMALGRMRSLADHTEWITLNDDHQCDRNAAAIKFSDWHQYFDFQTVHTPSEIETNQLNLEVELWDQAAVAKVRNDNEVGESSEEELILPDEISQPMDASIKQIIDFEYPDLALTQESAYQAVTDIKRLFDDPDNNLMAQLKVDQKQSSVVDLNVLDEEPKAAPQVHQFRQPDFMTTEVKASPAKIGTATHLLFQKIALNEKIDNAHVKALIHQLVFDGSITKEVAQKIDIDGIVAFYQTKLGQKIVANAPVVQREVPFALLLPAQMTLPNLTHLTDKKILIHGIIDGYFCDQQTGEVYLFDYKTDHASVSQIEKEYRGQLNLYAIALQQITGKPVNKRYLYSVKNRTNIES